MVATPGRAEVFQHRVTAPQPQQSWLEQCTVDLTGCAEILWSLRLLRTTCVPVSLFRVEVPGLDEALVAKALELACGKEGLIGHLPGSVHVLLTIGAGRADPAHAGQVTLALHRTLAVVAGRQDVPFLMADVHPCTAEIGEPEELLTQLALLPARRVDPACACAA